MKQQTNRAISTRILDTHPQAFIGLEALTGIRDRTKRKHGKRASKKQRKANRHASRWAFAELQGFFAVQGAADGKSVHQRGCRLHQSDVPRCGSPSKANRQDAGLLFVCCQCHDTLHADGVGARNSALRTPLIRQDWMSTGLLSVGPDASDREAKAARLARYAEVRWSLDASSPPSGGE